MKKVAIHNLGCKVNSYEAESMEQIGAEALKPLSSLNLSNT